MNRTTVFFAAALFSSAPAIAADLPSVQSVPAPAQAAPWEFDIAFGAGVASDYNFRGISQSDRGASVRGYIEAKYGWLYAGIAAFGVDLPTRPGAEIDLYGGIRPVLGPVTFDFGGIYYYYPSERALRDLTGTPVTFTNTDFWEVYAKATWQVSEPFSVGVNLFYSPSWLNTGASGTYASLTAALTLPYDLSLSGELGRYWLGVTNPLGGVTTSLPDYTYWNIGLTYTYQNTVKFDVRYHGTDLNRNECFTLTTDPRGVFDGSGRSRWCGDAVIATISFDTSLSALRATAAPR